MSAIVAVGFLAASAAGALTRYSASRALNHQLPIGTWLVNVAGAFCLGLLSGSGADALTIIGTGALGSVTTFSTLAHESVMLARHRRSTAAGYLLVTLLTGVAAAWVGLALTT